MRMFSLIGIGFLLIECAVVMLRPSSPERRRCVEELRNGMGLFVRAAHFRFLQYYIARFFVLRVNGTDVTLLITYLAWRGIGQWVGWRGVVAGQWSAVM